MKVITNIINKVNKSELLRRFKELGTVIIEEDKIICLVNEKKLKRKFDNNYNYKLELYGILKDYEEIAQNCGLNKKVEYVIENIEFDIPVFIDSYFNNEIIFRNCIFKKEIRIFNAVNITFENNKYIAENALWYCNTKLYGIIPYYTKNKINKNFVMFVPGMVDNIKFINDELALKRDFSVKNNIKENIMLYLCAKKIEFINSIVNTDSEIMIKAENLIINNTNIKTNETYIEAENIINNNSSIKSINGIIIDNKNNNTKIIDNINSSYIVYNNKEIIKKNIEQEHIKQYKRLLIEKLRIIRNECHNYIFNETTKFSDNLKEENIIKILKK